MDEQIYRLLASLDLDVSGFRALSDRGRTSTGREAWCVALKNQTLVKARRMSTAEQAKKVEEFLNPLPFEGFTKVLGRHEHYLIEEWIQGESLSEPNQESLKKAAQLLKRLHQNTMRESQSTKAQLESTLETLDGLPIEEKEVLKRKVKNADPGQALCSVIHYDFCGSNLVQAPSGEVWSIDNEWLRIGPVDMDLARTLWLWNLSESQRLSFLGHYGLEQPNLFWTIAAVAESAFHRLRAGLAAPEAPLRELSRLASA